MRFSFCSRQKIILHSLCQIEGKEKRNDLDHLPPMSVFPLLCYSEIQFFFALTSSFFLPQKKVSTKGRNNLFPFTIFSISSTWKSTRSHLSSLPLQLSAFLSQALSSQLFISRILLPFGGTPAPPVLFCIGGLGVEKSNLVRVGRA